VSGDPGGGPHSGSPATEVFYLNAIIINAIIIPSEQPMKPRRSSRCDGAIALEDQLKPPAGYDSGSPGVDIIAALIIAPDELDQLEADARRLGIARQCAQPAGHLPVMIAVGKRRRGAPARKSAQPFWASTRR